MTRCEEERTNEICHVNRKRRCTVDIDSEIEGSLGCGAAAV